MANLPSLKEILVAIKSKKSGKIPGLDGIPAEIYKYGGTALHAGEGERERERDRDRERTTLTETQNRIKKCNNIIC